ncbi:PTS sugar transporter subunit IIA [Zooshikella harenae]|uniref:PTS sugar transporter subunit IIA n=1 Tax=Zooshikella harenae TaxID=2827238 RepID=A0ABS5Z9P0_9GAMM|nr:PTS sugar transporter subunit IIA [Zooshikella harenae]MBU2710764.1 PTS sugar transporter subunit IIA [Zooshikella harenae]
MKKSLITKETILLDMDVESKTDAVHKMCAHLFLLKKTDNPSLLYLDIMNREQVVSTFAGMHTAIPHTVSQHINEPVLCFVRVRGEDFTWDGDDEDVRFIFLLSAPAQDDLKKLRQSQSYVFSSVAQLISRPEIIDLWLSTHDEQVILDSLNQAFESNLNITM